MTFSYTAGLSADKDKVRFYVDDVTENDGPFPEDTNGNHGNFSDEDLAGLITVEESWQRAVCACYERLSGAFASEAVIHAGPRREELETAAKTYRLKAIDCRKEYGYPTHEDAEASRAGVRHPTRIDGYSQDVSSDET